MNKKTAGFTLLELMVAVAIIGILASIAIPSYQDKVLKSRRADAKGVLAQLAGSMERQFTANNSYCNLASTAITGGAQVTGCTALVPTGITRINDTGAPNFFANKSPIDGNTVYYNLKINSVTPASASTSTAASVASGFTLYAVPVAGSPQAQDKCGTLILTSSGIRGLILLGSTTAIWQNDSNTTNLANFNNSGCW